jgi:hypothetical protein
MQQSLNTKTGISNIIKSSFLVVSIFLGTDHEVEFDEIEIIFVHEIEFVQ